MDVKLLLSELNVLICARATENITRCIVNDHILLIHLYNCPLGILNGYYKHCFGNRDSCGYHFAVLNSVVFISGHLQSKFIGGGGAIHLLGALGICV